MGKTTIKVVESLRAIFDYLPEHVGLDTNSYPIVFKAGDQKELLAFFAQSKGKTNYPLIWLDMPFDEKHYNRKRVKCDELVFILAVETNSQMLFSERLETTFKNVLYPLLDSVLDAFNQASTLSSKLDYRIVLFGNYSEQAEGLEGEFVDIWDVIKLSISIEINDNCLREIKL
jgi:hypothetical protein